jgi:hypothetical protein
MFNLGIEQQITKDLALKVAYVGTQGHFLPAGSSGARGQWTNQVDPKYLPLQGLLSTTVTAANASAVFAQAAALGFQLSLPYPSFSGQLSQMLKAFPQYSGVGDNYDSVDNSNYNALQVVLKQRMSRNLKFMFNYTWGAEIDDKGTFRSGYLPPASRARAARRIRRMSSIPPRSGTCRLAKVRQSTQAIASCVRWSADTSSPVSTLTTRATRLRS